MALVRRRLRANISLASVNGQLQSFDQGGDTVIAQNLRMSAHISHAGGPYGLMDLTIFGLKMSTMNRLSTLGMQINLVPKNPITLEAGDDTSDAMATVFSGYILAAYGDFNAAPEVAFHISAQCALPQAAIPAKPSSFKGTADVATIMSGLANQMGLGFENSGVSVKVSNQYLSGSYRTQAQALAKAANIAWAIDKGVLAIWPKNGSRNGQVPLVSPQTGMKGYPTYTAYGIIVETLFNPSITMGGKINVQSSLQAACGEWAIYNVDHDLECEVPENGKWFSTISAYNPKFPTPLAR
jgi:hypothetical protein